MKIEDLEDLEDSKTGNTGSLESSTLSRKSKTLQGKQKVKWFFTYNNFPKEEKEEIEEIFKKNCKKYIFEEEIGSKSHIEHLQGQCRFNTKNGRRLTEIKKIFHKYPGIHWKLTSNELAAIKYCTKDAECKSDIHSKGYYNEKMMFFDLFEDAKLRFINFEFYYYELLDNFCTENYCRSVKHAIAERDGFDEDEEDWTYHNEFYHQALNACISDDPSSYYQHLLYKERLEEKLALSLK